MTSTFLARCSLGHDPLVFSDRDAFTRHMKVDHQRTPQLALGNHDPNKGARGVLPHPKLGLPPVRLDAVEREWLGESVTAASVGDYRIGVVLARHPNPEALWVQYGDAFAEMRISVLQKVGA